MDMKNAFNGTLLKVVYMILLGYGDPRHVCGLCLAIYELKQTPRVWYECFCTVVLWAGFLESSGSLLFVCSTWHVLVLLYVDDMINIGDDARDI